MTAFDVVINKVIKIISRFLFISIFELLVNEENSGTSVFVSKGKARLLSIANRVPFLSS